MPITFNRHKFFHRKSSDETLDGGPIQNNQEKPEADSNGGSEEEGQQGPPKPVGFFDPRLHNTRIDVAKKWIFTSKNCLRRYYN